MKKLLLLCVALVTTGGMQAADYLTTTPYTVIAEVVSYEHYKAFRQMGQFSLDAPYGNESTIVAKIIAPASLAGREIAIPFESADEDHELLVRKGTTFRWEHHANLNELRGRTESIFRHVLPFPRRGIISLRNDGEIAAFYPGYSVASR
ncbi:MAG: hypothetical protein HYV95_07570 [Opitutae bacterium]|nr:hypothetical protein [Opitutae bacterium]